MQLSTTLENYAADAKPVLTIAIPTYNRQVQLKRCLEALVPQLNDQCVLRIYDNHSTEPMGDIVIPLLEKHRVPSWSITRRPFNIGGLGNIMHGYENVDTPWIWVMGDDDIPLPDAVARILSLTAQHPQTLAFGFEWHFPSDPASAADKDELVISSCAELLASRALRSISLISSCVYNAPAIHSVFGVGHDYSSSFFPHVSWLLRCLLRDGGSRPVRFSMTPLVTFKADGMYEVPMTPSILPNIRYLSRMLEKSEERAAIMKSSFARLFIGSPAERFRKPGLATIIAAAAFGHLEQSRVVLSRARRVAGESLEFDEAGWLLPISGFYSVLRLLFGIGIGICLGPLLRLAYKIKTQGGSDCPTLVSGFKSFRVP